MIRTRGLRIDETYESGLSRSDTLASEVYANETCRAASVKSHARPAEIIKPGDPVRHDGNPIARGGILWSVVRIPHDNLLIV